MAKWKNALLISTIVAPIAFGASPLGDALASTKDNRPDSTDVQVHKFLKSSGDSDSQNYYWGNGTEGENNPFTASGTEWSPVTKPGYEFTAYKIPTKVTVAEKEVNLITFANNDGEKADKPVIKHVAVGTGDLADVYWDEIISVADASTASNKESTNPGNKVSTWSLSLDLSTLSPDKNAAFMAYLNGLPVTDKQTQPVSTTATAGAPAGTASFDDLANGNWIIMETKAPANVKTEAQTMVLSLPMMNPTVTDVSDKTDTGYWFDNSTTPLHLYPKDYTDLGNLKVVKKNGDTKAGKEGATIGMFQLPEGAFAGLQASVTAAISDLGTDATNEEIHDAIIDVLTDAGAKDINGEAGVSEQETTVDGTLFQGLMPGDTYYVMETQAPEGFEINGHIQEVTLSDARSATGSDTEVGGSDTTVDYKGGEYEFNNYNTPTADKDINVQKHVADGELKVKTDSNGNAAYDSNGNPIYLDANNNEVFVDDDKNLGVTRGQVFDYTVNLELNKDIADYTYYKFTDTIPYEVQINSWRLYAQINGSLTQLIQAVDPTSVDGDANFNDGLGQAEQTYSSGADGDPAHDVRFIFPDAAAAAIFGSDATAAYEADHAAGGDGYTNQNAYISANLLYMRGYTSSYTLSDDKRSIESSKPGEMKVDTKDAFRQALGNWSTLQDDESGNTSLVFKMNAQTNSAAQVDFAIDNKVDFDFNNGYENGTDTDTAKTYAVGWEFKKTDGDGDPIAGAGFTLGRLVTENNVENIIAALLTASNNGNVVDSEHLAKMVAAYNLPAGSDADDVTNHIKTVVAPELRDAVENDEEKFVYFVHLDQGQTVGDESGVNKQPVFGPMGDQQEMGDIYWTDQPTLATEHRTGDDGYMQFCGLGGGRYILTETTTPAGYSTRAPQKFTLTTPTSDAQYQPNEEWPGLVASVYNGDGDIVPVADQGTYGQGSDTAITGNVDPKVGGATNTNEFVQITNEQKSIFPLVGGIGSLFAVIAGLLAMGLALLKRKKDMKNEA